MSNATTDRSASAKRAWETRRKNADHKKRSEAAHRAWETRRANKLAAEAAAKPKKKAKA